MDPATVRVELAERSYEVQVGDGILADSPAQFSIAPCACALVTDTNVAPLYAPLVERALLERGFEVQTIIVPAGEPSKCMRQAEQIIEQMIAARLDRHSFLFSLGGGVVGDLAGFTASIFLRGIPWAQIPTTIVAQVDSAVGGKTGVNANGGKNLIGTFHQPSAVIADVATLRTLPRREWNEGWAEIIKHAIIRDTELFEQIEATPELDMVALVQRNVAIKAAIVAADEREHSGERALLNFGHTLGHAIEAAAGYGTYLHGEAIALGIVAACRISEWRAGFPPEHTNRVIQLLRRFDLPVTLPASLEIDPILQATLSDKKFEQGAIRFVVADQIGSARVSPDVTTTDLKDALATLRGDCS
jgi:3-dehydroquinate synthase